MGQAYSGRNVNLKKSNMKGQAQSLSDFNGKSIKWYSWKKKTRSAIGQAGMLGILDDAKYAERNPMDNEMVFHMFSIMIRKLNTFLQTSRDQDI